MHLTLELYLMVLRGELPPAVLVEVAHRHLLDRCPECASNWEIYQRGRDRRLPIAAGEASSRSQDPRHRAAFGPAARRVEEGDEKRRDERRRARRDLNVLLTLPPESWAEKVARARRRFRTRGFGELLLAEARQRFATEPRLAARLAALVPVVAHWIPGDGDEGWRHDLVALSTAYLANIHRIQGELDRASELFSDLRSRLAGRPVHETSLHAEIDSLEASLRFDQRRFEEAAALLDRAVLVASTTAAQDLQARLLLQRASLHRNREDHGSAERDLARAMELLAGRPHGDLLTKAVGARALALVELERFDAAEALLAEHGEEIQASDAWARLLVRGLEGRIALGRGEHAAAEAAFTEVRDGALDLGRPYDAALASLDLAEVYLAEGRSRELAELAAGLVPAFEARGVGREALAAFALLRQAVAAEEVSAALLTEVRRRVRGSR